MIRVGAVEGGAFDEDTIFLFHNSHSALKTCVENKKRKGHTSLTVNILSCEDCDVNYDTYKQVRDTILKVSHETGVALGIRDWKLGYVPAYRL
jgi:hypothetical protein